ncbi:MAG: hypothetical protein IJ828_11860 [Treponema sp.]|nr:hypothetical protein [Treponema sp.]
MYKQGGTESYTAFVLQTLQMLYPESSFTLIGEKMNSAKREMNEKMQLELMKGGG